MTESYFKEDPTILTANGTRNIKGIGRLSEFPQVQRSWTKVSSDHLKYGAESLISMEDLRLNQFNVQQRAINGIVESIREQHRHSNLRSPNSRGKHIGNGRSGSNMGQRNSKLPKLQSMTSYEESKQWTRTTTTHFEGGILLLNPHDYASLMQNSKVHQQPILQDCGRCKQREGRTDMRFDYC
jgi:hypothetical protein